MSALVHEHDFTMCGPSIGPLCHSCSLQPRSACTPSTKHVHGDDAVAAAPWGTDLVLLSGAEKEAPLRLCTGTAPDSNGREEPALRTTRPPAAGTGPGASRRDASLASRTSLSSGACSRDMRSCIITEAWSGVALTSHREPSGVDCRGDHPPKPIGCLSAEGRLLRAPMGGAMLNRGDCLGVLVVLPTLPTDNTGDRAPKEAMLPEARLKAGRLGKPSPPRDPWRSDHAWTTSHGEDLGAPSFAYGDSGVDGMALTFLASDECFHSALDELVREPRKEDAGIDSSSTSKGCKGCEASRSVFMDDASPPKPSKSSTDARVWDDELGPIRFFICEGCRLPAILSRGRKIANLL